MGHLVVRGINLWRQHLILDVIKHCDHLRQYKKYLQEIETLIGGYPPPIRSLTSSQRSHLQLEVSYSNGRCLTANSRCQPLIRGFSHPMGGVSPELESHPKKEISDLQSEVSSLIGIPHLQMEVYHPPSDVSFLQAESFTSNRGFSSLIKSLLPATGGVSPALMHIHTHFFILFEK